MVEVSVSWLQAFIQALLSTAVFPQGSSFFTIYRYYIQGFPQVLRTWEGLQSIHGEGGGGGKMLSKNTCDEVHLDSTVAAYKPANLLKINFFTHILQGGASVLTKAKRFCLKPFFLKDSVSLIFA